MYESTMRAHLLQSLVMARTGIITPNPVTRFAGATTTAGSARAKVLRYLDSGLADREEWRGWLSLVGNATGPSGSLGRAARLTLDLFELQREEDKYVPVSQGWTNGQGSLFTDRSSAFYFFVFIFDLS